MLMNLHLVIAGLEIIREIVSRVEIIEEIFTGTNSISLRTIVSLSRLEPLNIYEPIMTSSKHWPSVRWVIKSNQNTQYFMQSPHFHHVPKWIIIAAPTRLLSSHFYFIRSLNFQVKSLSLPNMWGSCLTVVDKITVIATWSVVWGNVMLSFLNLRCLVMHSRQLGTLWGEDMGVCWSLK